MADGFATLPRAGTVEVIQEFGTAPAVPARPILSPVIIGESHQIETQKFAGFYQGRFQVLDENVGTGTGVQTVFQLDFEPVILSSVELHVGSISGTLLAPTTDYTVSTVGQIVLTPAGVAALSLSDLHAAYLYALSQTYVYPEIKQGAEILYPGTDVSVYLRTVEDIFDITDGFSVIVNATSVTVPGDIQPFRYVTTANGQVEVLSATGTIEDTSLDFYDLGIRAGDVVRFITDAADLQYPDSIVSTDTAEHVVLSIPAVNSVTMSPDIAAQGGKVEYEIIRKGSQNGDILISYRARRQDKVGILMEFEDVTQVEEDLGPISVDNPLAYGLAKALGATDRTVFGVMVKDQDSLTEHQKALDFLEGEEVYALVPLTTDRAIHQIYNQHCINLSDAASMHERRVYATVVASTRHSFQDLSVTGTVSVGSTTFTDTNAKFFSNGVPVGSVIRLQSPASVELADVARTELIIASVTSETTVSLVSPVTQGTLVTGEAVGSGTGAQTNFQLNATTNVIPSSVVMYLDGVRVDSTDYTASVNGVVVFLNPPGLGVAVTSDYEVSTITGIQYTVESQDLTNFEIAKDVAAAAEGYASRRITVTFADKAVVEGNTEAEPYYFNCALAGLVSALPPNQPIANIPIPGFTAVKHLRKFTETHFGIMAAGGVSVIIQDRDTSPIVLRNWMTTDMMNVNTRECSIVQMADYYSKYLRRNVSSIAGRFNITEDYIDNMLRPAINGVNREMITAGFAGTGTQIISIEQSTVQKDQIFVVEELELFAPANKIIITVRII
jgi:hypothetical protein